MASIRKIEGKSGISYKITVTHGRDSTGKQKRHFMTWIPDEKMTARQAEKAVKDIASDFEKKILKGFVADNRQSFEQYAEYVVRVKESAGAKTRTVEWYREQLPRINAAIGHLKLQDIKVQHLNEFYANLKEEGIRESPIKATPKKDIASLLKEKKLSIAALSRSCGKAESTLSAAVHGRTVSKETADCLASALGYKTESLFELAQDKAPLSPVTIAGYHRVISSVLGQAEKERIIDRNPAHFADPPALDREEPESFEIDEMERILEELEHASVKWQTIAMLLIFSGCRRGEIAGLKWDAVDLDNKQLYIHETLNYTSKKGIYPENSTKTRDTRFIKVDQEIVDQLKIYRAWQDGLRLKNDDQWIETGYVFTRDNGAPINPTSITQWVSKFLKRVGFEGSPHKFRHSMSSIMIRNGVDIAAVSKRLGHKSITTTLGIYTHSLKEADARAAEAYSEFIRGNKAVKSAV